MDAITELLATLRGGQPPLVRWDPSAHNQSTHGRFIERGGKPGAAPETTPDSGTATGGPK
jgi:1-acyl-sn-glycerol-3-phosphate acyltransferase